MTTHSGCCLRTWRARRNRGLHERCNGYAPLRSFALVGTACSINAFLKSAVSCLIRFFLTQPAALSRRRRTQGTTTSPVAMTGAAAMLAGSFLPWGIPCAGRAVRHRRRRSGATAARGAPRCGHAGSDRRHRTTHGADGHPQQAGRHLAARRQGIGRVVCGRRRPCRNAASWRTRLHDGKRPCADPPSRTSPNARRSR